MLSLEEAWEALLFQLRITQKRLTLDELKLRPNILTRRAFSPSLSWVLCSALYYSTQHFSLWSCSWHKWSDKSPLFKIIEVLSASVLLWAFWFKRKGCHFSATVKYMRLQILLGKEATHHLTWIEGQRAFLPAPVSFPTRYRKSKCLQIN